MRLTSDSVVVVTGGADGIGRAVAHECLELGCRVWVADVREAALTSALQALGADADPELRSRADRVRGSVVDVRDRAAVRELRDLVVREWDATVTLLVCCAGVFGGDPLPDVTYDAFDRVMAVNFTGTLNCVKEFLPHIIDTSERDDDVGSANPLRAFARSVVFGPRKTAGVCVVSSVDGLFGMPRANAYCASKFAVTGFARSLEMDLAITSPHVLVSCVHPGFISTNIILNNAEHLSFSSALAPSAQPPQSSADKHALAARVSDAFRFIGSTSPRDAALQMLAGVTSDRTRILVGNDAVILDLVHRVAPSLFHKPAFFGLMLAVVLPLCKFVGRRILACALAALILIRWRRAERAMLGSSPAR